MRQRPWWLNSLLGEGDSSGFNGSDPDWKIAIPANLLEKNYRLVGRHLHSDSHHVDGMEVHANDFR
jgi:hypothetical protein